MADYKYGTAYRDVAYFIKEMTRLLGLPCRTNLGTVMLEMQRVAEEMQERTAWLAQQAANHGFADADEYVEQAKQEEKQRGFANG
jgi:hypothetical protein